MVKVATPAMDGGLNGAGFYRVHLQSPDGDWITIFVPLDETGRLDPDRPRPYLFKSLWDNNLYLGELLVDRGAEHRLEWAAEAPDSLTDLLTVPLQPNALVRVWTADSKDSDVYTFRVRAMQKL
jgi:hypothetical protein